MSPMVHPHDSLQRACEPSAPQLCESIHKSEFLNLNLYVGLRSMLDV